MLHDIIVIHTNALLFLIDFVRNHTSYLLALLIMGFMAYKEIRNERTRQLDDKRKIT